MVLETERLTIRPPQMDDVDDFFAMFSDAKALKYWSEPAWTERGQAEKRVSRMIEISNEGRDHPLVIVDRMNERVIGTCTLFKIFEQSRRAELGYSLDRSHWGKGLATEAMTALLEAGFYDLNLNRVEADIDPRNERSKRLLERLGFQLEGLCRERWIVGDKKMDTAWYGLLSADWASQSGKPSR